MQFVRGQIASTVIPFSEAAILRKNKRNVGEADRQAASNMQRMMLDHFRSVADYSCFYSLPLEVFADLPKQSLCLAPLGPWLCRLMACGRGSVFISILSMTVSICLA